MKKYILGLFMFLALFIMPTAVINASSGTSIENTGLNQSFNTLLIDDEFTYYTQGSAEDYDQHDYDSFLDNIGSLFFVHVNEVARYDEYQLEMTLTGQKSSREYKLTFTESKISSNLVFNYNVTLSYLETTRNILSFNYYYDDREVRVQNYDSTVGLPEDVYITDLGSWEGFYPATASYVETNESEASLLSVYGFNTATLPDTEAPTVVTEEIVLDLENLPTEDELLKLVEATDDRDIELDLIVETTSYTQAKEVGTFYINVYAKDDANNASAVKTIAIIVKDYTAPVMDANPKTTDSSVVLSEEELLALFTATDNYYSEKQITIEITNDEYTPNSNVPGNYSVTAQATDPSGNYSSITTYVTVTGNIVEDTPGDNNQNTGGTGSNNNTGSNNSGTGSTDENVDAKYEFKFGNIFKGEFWSNYSTGWANNFAWPHITTIVLGLIMLVSVIAVVKEKKK